MLLFFLIYLYSFCLVSFSFTSVTCKSSTCPLAHCESYGESVFTHGLTQSLRCLPEKLWRTSGASDSAISSSGDRQETLWGLVLVWKQLLKDSCCFCLFMEKWHFSGECHSGKRQVIVNTKQKSSVFFYVGLLFSSKHKCRSVLSQLFIERDKAGLHWPGTRQDRRPWDVCWREEVQPEPRSLPLCREYRRRDCVTCIYEGSVWSSDVLLLEVVMCSSLSAEHSTHTGSRERRESDDPLTASHAADGAVVRGFYQRRLWNPRAAGQALRWGGQRWGRKGGWGPAEEVMHTLRSGQTVAWWLATGLPECEGSQPLRGSGFLTTCCPMLYKLWHAVLTPDLD